jgi:hypothetical protein
MACNANCTLCKKLVISQAVTFADGTLTINLPAGSYTNGERYCIIVAQTIPAATTIVAPVVVTIGDGTEEYPLVGNCCQQITAASLRTRTKYPTRVVTDGTTGTFRLLYPIQCGPKYVRASIDGTAPAAEGGGA